MAEAITGRIYRIISESHPECLPYYGSTTIKLTHRWNQHTSGYNICSSKQLMEFEDVRMELVEEFVCDSITTLRQREQWYIDNHPCCNMKNAYGLDKENAKEYFKRYDESRKDQQQERLKKYYEENKEKLQKKQNQYYEDNGEERREYARQYKEANRERINEKNRQRYAKKKLAE